MEKLFKENADGTLTVSCSYTNEEYVPVLNKVAQSLAQNVTVKGFRKGHAPLDRAIQYIKDSDIYNGMVKKLINRDFATLLDGYENGQTVANIQPDLNVEFDEKAKVYTFVYTFFRLPSAELKKYTGYKITVEPKEVTDEEVTAKLEDLRKDQAELVPSEEAAKLTDTVNIDFTGFVDEKTFEGGSAKSYDLVLGSNSFIPGFEQELVGLKEGEHKSFRISFPENYVKSLAGKEARFEVTVNSVKSQLLPEVDDEFAKSVDKYNAESVADLKEKIKAELAQNHEAAARGQKLDQIIAAVEKDASFVIADRYLDANAKSIMEQRLSQIKQYGLDKAEYLQLIGQTEEQFEADAKNSAASEARIYAIFEAVKADAKIELADEDMHTALGGKEKYEEFVTNLNKEDSAQAARYLDQIKSNLLHRKIEDYLLANN